MPFHSPRRRLKGRGLASSLCLLAALSTPLAAEDWNIGLGAGVITGPEYPGAGDTETAAVPSFDIAYRNRVFFNFYEGLSGYLYTRGQFNLKAGIGYARGRDADDDDSLAGLPDIGDSTLLRFGAEYRLGRYTAFVTAEQHYGGTDGRQLVTGIQAFYSLREELSSPVVLLNFAAVYSDREHMDGFFGVDESDAAASGIPAYAANAGPSSLRAGVTWVYPLTQSWRLTALLQYSRFVGDAADSPLVADEDQAFGGAFVGYRF